MVRKRGRKAKNEGPLPSTDSSVPIVVIVVAVVIVNPFYCYETRLSCIIAVCCKLCFPLFFHSFFLLTSGVVMEGRNRLDVAIVCGTVLFVRAPLLLSSISSLLTPHLLISNTTYPLNIHQSIHLATLSYVLPMFHFDSGSKQ